MPVHTPFPVTDALLRARRHVDLMRTSTALCHS